MTYISNCYHVLSPLYCRTSWFAFDIVTNFNFGVLRTRYLLLIIILRVGTIVQDLHYKYIKSQSCGESKTNTNQVQYKDKVFSTLRLWLRYGLLCSLHSLGDFLLPLPKKFSPKRIRRNMTNKGSQHLKPNSKVQPTVKRREKFHSPFSLFLFRIRKEDYLLILRENKAERAFDAIMVIILVRATPRFLIISDSNRLLEIDGCSCLLCNIVKSNQIRTSDPQLPSSPGLKNTLE